MTGPSLLDAAGIDNSPLLMVVIVISVIVRPF